MKVVLKMANGHKETFLNVREVVTTNECGESLAEFGMSPNNWLPGSSLIHEKPVPVDLAMSTFAPLETIQ